MKYNILIIGAGIIGASIARELSKYNLKIIVLESNKTYGLETTTGNGGVIHGGFDPTPGKLNAELNRIGKIEYNALFEEIDFEHKQINSIVVGFGPEEDQEIIKLYNRGLKNKVDPNEIKIISGNQARKLEPFLSKEVTSALLCTSSILINPVQFTGQMLRNAKKNGVQVEFDSKVASIKKANNDFIVSTPKETYEAQYIINCAGHYADKIAEMAGHFDFKQNTRRGEYIILEKDQSYLVNSIIFMLPTKYGKGVTVAPMLDGRVMVGPTAENGVPKEDTRLITEEKHEEIKKIGLKLIDKIDYSRTCARWSGSRPIWEEGDDFYINYAKSDDHFIIVGGIKSPGLSSAPAIAKMVVDMLEKTKINMVLKNNFIKEEKDILLQK